jgi:hypothetical protein
MGGMPSAGGIAPEGDRQGRAHGTHLLAPHDTHELAKNSLSHREDVGEKRT